MKKHEHILYKNFEQVRQDIKEIITDVLNKRGTK